MSVNMQTFNAVIHTRIYKVDYKHFMQYDSTGNQQHMHYSYIHVKKLNMSMCHIGVLQSKIFTK